MVRRRDFIYAEIAKEIDSLLVVDNPHTHVSQKVRDFPASFVRIWFTEQETASSNLEQRLAELAPNSLGRVIKTTILFIEDRIEITHQAHPDALPVGIEYDLTDPDCWETLLRWMQDNSLVPRSTVLTGELAK